MNVGIVGLGKMGNAIAYRLIKAGHEVVGFDLSEEMRREAREIGVALVDSLDELVGRVSIVWLMVPAGDIIENVFNQILPQLKASAIIIDGGNSYYENSVKRAHKAAEHGVHFLDCGTSGGIRGRHDGFCLMVGGDKKAYDTVLPLFEAIAAPDGVAHIGVSGTGHYVKMVHNGIEYALLQSYAEGLHLIKQGSFAAENIDLEKLTHLWNQSSIIRSFILKLAHDIFVEDQELKYISGSVAESGMGLWTVEEAHKNNIPVREIEEALAIRKWSRKTGGNYGTKLVAMMRKEFGGHAVKKVGE